MMAEETPAQGGTSAHAETGDRSLPGAALTVLHHLARGDEAAVLGAFVAYGDGAASAGVAIHYGPLTTELAQALQGWYHEGRPTEDDPVMRRVLATLR